MLLFFILLISGCVQEETVYVANVIDGDTLVTADGIHIRLLGINAPEKNEYLYEESTEYLRNLIEGKYVTLERDETNKDWYGRKLRYVYLGNKFINAEMLEKGYARLYLLKDKKYENTLKYAELDAQNLQIGVWQYT